MSSSSVFSWLGRSRRFTLQASSGRLAAPKPGARTILALEPLETRLLLWTSVLDEGQVRALALDPYDNVIAAGTEAGFGHEFVVAKFDGQDGTYFWGTAISESYVSAVALDKAGDVFAGGEIIPGDVKFGVVKLSGQNGRVLWRHDVHSGRVIDLKLDAAGDVLAVGQIFNPGTRFDFAVVKLRGSDGEELWRQTLDGSADGLDFDSANAVRLDANGDVVVAGYLENAGTGRDFVVAKFAGTDGAEQWRYELQGTRPDGSDAAHSLSLDAAGDVAVVGVVNNLDRSWFTVVKLSAADGTELWRNEFGRFVNSFGDVTFDASGDVFTTAENFGAYKWAGSDGSPLWSQLFPGSAPSVTVDSAGNALVAGRLSGRFGVAKLGAEDGSELWQRGIGKFSFGATRVVVDSSDNVVAGGSVESLFAVVKLNGEDGSDFGPGGFPGGGPASAPGTLVVFALSDETPRPSAEATPSVVVAMDRFFAAESEPEPPARVGRALDGCPVSETERAPRRRVDPLFDLAWSALAGWYSRP